MNSIETLTTFFGWCTVINFGILLFGTLALMLMQDSIMSIHTKLFGFSNEDLSRAYFQYLAQYKIFIIVFNLVPYIALEIMT
jgi:hypothetical protein